MARTIWGTSTVLRTPPASRMYMLFGTVLAMVNISACRVPLPNKNTNSISRPKPSTRDTRVPATMIALAEINREVRLVVEGSETSVSDIDRFGYLARRRPGGQAGGCLRRPACRGAFPGHLADAQCNTADQHRTRDQHNDPAGGTCLGRRHLNCYRLPDRSARGCGHLGGNRNCAVGRGVHLCRAGKVCTGPYYIDIDRFHGQPLADLGAEDQPDPYRVGQRSGVLRGGKGVADGDREAALAGDSGYPAAGPDLDLVVQDGVEFGLLRADEAPHRTDRSAPLATGRPSEGGGCLHVRRVRLGQQLGVSVVASGQETHHPELVRPQFTGPRRLRVTELEVPGCRVGTQQLA